MSHFFTLSVLLCGRCNRNTEICTETSKILLCCVSSLYLSAIYVRCSENKLCYLWGSCRSFIKTIKWCLKYVWFLSFPPKTSSYLRCNSVCICCKLMLVWLLLCNTSALKMESIKSIQHEIKIKDKFMIYLWNQHIKIKSPFHLILLWLNHYSI